MTRLAASLCHITHHIVLTSSLATEINTELLARMNLEYLGLPLALSSQNHSKCFFLSTLTYFLIIRNLLTLTFPLFR